MSDTSIQRFSDLARLSGSGEIRYAKGGDELINKGTFGHRVASFFRAIGEALHIVQPDPTRAQRQADALNDFKEVMTGRYGASLTNQAFQALGLDQPNAALTGRKIEQAREIARGQIAHNHQANLNLLRDHLPPRGESEATDAFKAVADAMKPKLDPPVLSDEAAKEYRTRLGEAMDSHARLGREALTPEAVRKLATAALKQTLKLEAEGGIAAASEARVQYAAAVKEALEAIGRGESPSQLVPRLALMSQRFETMLEAELLDEAGGEELTSFTESAVFRALKQIQAESPEFAREIQRKALADGSPLAAVLGAASSGRGLPSGATNNHIKLGGQITAFTGAIVGSLATMLNPLGKSGSDDVDRLTDGPGVTQQQKTEALQAIRLAMKDVPPEFTMDELLLRGMRGLNAETATATEMDRRVGEHVVMLGETQDLSREEVLESLRRTAEDFPLKPEVKRALMDAIKRAAG
jgi:hypothetical protein